MDWMEEFISQVLADVPRGSYRTRAEKELRDHLEALYQAEPWKKEEILVAMGEPEKLQKEYEAAWRRSLPGRIKELRCRLGAWAKGWLVMFGTHCAIFLVIGTVNNMALSLPGDSLDPWVRLIRGTLGDLHNSLFWRHLFPLGSALMVGAYYLSRKFQTSRRPARPISAGLSLHWAFITLFRTWWYTVKAHHLSFWAAVGRHFYYNTWYYVLTFALCVLLGYLFGRNTERSRELA